jgi:Tol biopolymer transport system component
VDVTRDGRYILYQGEGKIWRIDADGRNPRQLTFGALDVHPASSADSRLVIYASFPGWSPGSGGKPELWEVPIDGGTPIELSTVPASMPKVSPDGKWIGFVYLAGPNFARRELGVMPAEPGAPVKLFENVPPVWYDITWAPDGKALDFGVITEGVGNLWRQPLDGSPPRQITHFNIGQTFDMAWSPDGQRLAIARGQTIREVVLIGKRSADQDH